MLPLVFKTISTAAVKAIVGAVPARIYRHGEAPEGVARPYITWFTVIGNPENQLSGAPGSDADTVQIDCWSESDTEVETLAAAVRDALDAAGVANRIVVDTFESDTKLYRVGQEADFILIRS